MNQRTNNAGAARHNREAWDQLAKHQQRFTRAAKDEEFLDPLSILDGNGWLGGNIHGNIDGNIHGEIDGNIDGDIDGDMNGDSDSDIHGEIDGTFLRSTPECVVA